MNEYFLAGDSVDLWTKASKQALASAGFKNIQSGPDGVLTAEKAGPFRLTIRPSNEGGVVIEIDAENPADSGLYKQHAAQAYAALKAQPAIEEPKPPAPVEAEELEPIGSPESVQPDLSKAFKPAFETETPEPAPPKVVRPPAQAEGPEPKVPFYQTDWFTLLLLILIPPVGLVLMWVFKVFDKKLRIGLTVFFLLYFVLWGWLLYLPFVPTSTTEEEAPASQVEALNAYWDNMYVSQFNTEIPPQMQEYESLYLNGMLVSETGLNRARVILPEVQALCTQVLSLEPVPASDPAYPVQQSVNAAADSFNNAIAAGQDALSSGDPAGLADTVDLWNTAMNAFYQIDYIYDQALQSAEVADGLIEAPQEVAPPQNPQEVTPPQDSQPVETPQVEPEGTPTEESGETGEVLEETQEETETAVE